MALPGYLLPASSLGSLRKQSPFLPSPSPFCICPEPSSLRCPDTFHGLVIALSVKSADSEQGLMGSCQDLGVLPI